MELTPAQVVFLETSVDGFSLNGWSVELAGQAASSRRFFRVYNDNTSYILVEWDSRDEDWPRFLGIEAFVSGAGICVLPKIFASDPVHGLILEEDLGTATLKDFCVRSYLADMAHPVEDVYRQVIDAMRAWHKLDICKCQHITSRTMDIETFLWESGYFTEHCVIGYFGKEDILSFDWETERQRMAERAAKLPKVNMHRDLQSENVMIHNGRIRFVDFQGARLGPAHYDAASLLLDPYIEFMNDTANKLIDHYFDQTADNDRADFYVCAAQRLMQALGAYGNLSLHKGKPHYRQFIPIAINRLSSIFNEHLPDYPAMREVINVCRQAL